MRTLIVEADGASRGNPGAASYGTVVRDADTGELLAELAEAIGRATNNVAEYRGVIAGLEAVRQIDPAARVEVRLDSKLVVEQLSGRWQVKHQDMKPLAERARRAFPANGVTFAWVPRSQNKHADKLANQALDAAARGEVWRSQTPLGGARGAEGGDSAGDGGSVDGLSGSGSAARVGGSETAAAVPAGVAQARAAARRFAGPDRLGDPRYGRIDAIIASPLRRTQQTALAVADATGLDPRIEEGYRELDFGAFEGLTFAEARERYPDELNAFLSSPKAPAPGGESVEQVAARAAAARERTLARFPRQTVLVVTHVTPIKTLLCQALGAPLEAVHRMELAAASLSVIDFYGDGVANVRCVNDVAHLTA